MRSPNRRWRTFIILYYPRGSLLQPPLLWTCSTSSLCNLSLSRSKNPELVNSTILLKHRTHSDCLQGVHKSVGLHASETAAGENFSFSAPRSTLPTQVLLSGSSLQLLVCPLPPELTGNHCPKNEPLVDQVIVMACAFPSSDCFLHGGPLSKVRDFHAVQVYLYLRSCCRQQYQFPWQPLLHIQTLSSPVSSSLWQEL